MALINCPECGKEFSDKAPACPNCGCPTQEIGRVENSFIKSFDDAFVGVKAQKAVNFNSIAKIKKMIGENENVFLSAVVNVSIAPLHGELNPKMSVKGKEAGVLAITSHRVLFVGSKPLISGEKEIFIRDISSVDSKHNLMTCQVRIKGMTEMFVIDCNSSLQSRIMNALSEARK